MGHQLSMVPLEALTNELRSMEHQVVLNMELTLPLGLGHQEVQKLGVHR